MDITYRCCFFFFQAEDGIRDYKVTGVQTCALPIFVEEDHAPVAVGTMRLAQQRSDQRVAAARLVHYGGAIRIELLAKALDALRQRADAQVRAPVDHQPGRLTGGVGVDDLDRLDLSFPSRRHVEPSRGPRGPCALDPP